MFLHQLNHAGVCSFRLELASQFKVPKQTLSHLVLTLIHSATIHAHDYFSFYHCLLHKGGNGLSPRSNNPRALLMRAALVGNGRHPSSIYPQTKPLPTHCLLIVLL